jgi:hypothetical protein
MFTKCAREDKRGVELISMRFRSVAFGMASRTGSTMQ